MEIAEDYGCELGMIYMLMNSGIQILILVLFR